LIDEFLIEWLMEVGLIRSTIITLDAIVRTVRTSKCGEGVTEAKVASGELVVRTAGAKNQLFGIWYWNQFRRKKNFHLHFVIGPSFVF
jgi:hypothetical protein